MDRIEGLINLPFGIWFVKSVLGKEFPIKISNFIGVSALPRYPINKKKLQLILHSQLRPPKNIQSSMYDDYNTNWGHPVLYPDGISEVNALAIWFDFDNKELSLKNSMKIYEQSSDWLNRFREFTEIITGQEVRRTPRIITKDLKTELWIYDKDNKPYHFKGKNLSRIKIPNKDQYVNTAIFKKIISHCSDGYSPNLIRILFKDSIRAFDHHEMRRAILDATTAIELLLTQKIRSILIKKHDPSFCDSILEKYKTLGSLFELSKILKIQLPSGELQKEIVKPRNDAIHRGLVPRESIARKILFKCEELINIHRVPITEQNL